MQQYSRGILYSVITAICWGFLAIALKVTVMKVDPFTVVWFRFLVAFILLAAWLAWKKPEEFRIFLKPPLILVVAAFALSWNYLSFMMGIDYTTPSISQVFIQTGPILLSVAGFLFFREKIRIRQVFGFLLSICGFFLFFNQQLATFEGSGDRLRQGVVIILSSASAWALYAIFQKILVKKYTDTMLNLFLFGIPIILFLPFVKFQPLLSLSFTWWLLLFFVGVNTLIAYTFVARALKLIEAYKVSIIIVLNPIITFVCMGILTWLDVSWIGHEHYTPLTIGGALLVLVGSILVAWKKSRSARKKTAHKIANHL